MEKEKSFWQHETAIVDEGAVVGEGTKFWHWVHVCGKNTLIGKNCSFGQNVYIGNDISIGDGVKVQNNVSIYDGVHLQDSVFVGPSAVFTNVINPRSHIVRKHEIRKTTVKKGASIGANATIVCGYDIGSYAFIAAGAVVTKSVPDYALMMGVPAQRKGWVCHCGVGLEGEGEVTCSSCGSDFTITEDSCSPRS